MVAVCLLVFVLSWLVDTAPVYWSKSIEIIRPYTLLVHAHILSVLDVLYQMARPIVDFCYLYMKHLFAAVSYLMPCFITTCMFCSSVNACMPSVL